MTGNPAKQSSGYFCSLESTTRDEPLLGSAPRADVWFLLEYNGRWGSKAFDESDIPERVKAAINAQLAEIPHARLLLVKQDGRPGDEIAFFAAVANAEQPRMYRFSLNTYDDLPGIELAALADGREHYARALTDEQLFALCTNGLRDQCCAINGAQALGALRDEFGEWLWQSTHHGGHRYGSNLLVMPDGLSFGRMHSEDAAETLRACRRGELSLEHLRGRSSLEAVAQAAEILLREATGQGQLDGMRLAGVEELPGDQWAVQFQDGGSTQKALLQRHVSDTPIQASCVGDKLAPIVHYELLEHQTA